MADQFQGDPQIFMGIDGPRLEFVQGQSIMVNLLDNGLPDLWNAVVISLFTSEKWPGNDLFQDVNEEIGSDFETRADQTITLANLNKMQNAANRALAWITETGGAKNIETRIRNPFGSNIELVIEMELNDGSSFNMVATRNGSRWLVERFV